MPWAVRLTKTTHPRVPFMVAVPASVTGTKRVRRYFASREKATAYVIACKQQGFFGAEGQGQPAGGQVTLGEAAALWLARMEVHKGTFFQCRAILAPLVARHGRNPIDSIGHRELDAWLRSLNGLAPATVLNYWRITRRFFGWAQDFLEAIPRNPMRKLQAPRLEHKDPEILTPEQMRACLDHCHDHRLTAYLSLGAFAGLRTGEILSQRWEDIDWEHAELYVRSPKRVRGWRPRHVEILPALRRHLEAVALKEGPIFSGRRALYELRREMMDQLNWPRWPRNCLRHSFRTYWLAQWQDAPKLAVQMGHAGVGMTIYNYGTPSTKANASAWWAL